MSLFLENFRWLFLLIGVLIAGLLAWAFWPSSNAYTPVSQEVVTVTDSTEIRALRDSLSMMRTHNQSTRIIRVTLRDTINGTTAIYLDSGAVVHDTVAMTRVVRDTMAIHVRDTVYVKKEFSKEAKKKWGLDAGAFVSYEPLETVDYGLSAGIRYKIIGPVFVGSSVDKKGFSNLTDSWTIRAFTGIEF